MLRNPQFLTILQISRGLVSTDYGSLALIYLSRHALMLVKHPVHNGNEDVTVQVIKVNDISNMNPADGQQRASEMSAYQRAFHTPDMCISEDRFPHLIHSAVNINAISG